MGSSTCAWNTIQHGRSLRIEIRDASTKQTGNWSGCHSVAWDANAPAHRGDLTLTNQLTKSGYPLGLMFNSSGARFVDEGIDMRNFTYAKFGREILQQADGIAFQVWDSEGARWLRDEEYAPGIVQRIEADTTESLSEKLATKGLNDTRAFVNSINEYNVAVQAHRRENPHLKFDPSRKDGLSTSSSSYALPLNKMNWALPISKAPFVAVKVTCGVTFTFGGLQVHHENSAVISEATSEQVPDLFCAGEKLGGLFYGNYPGGSGLSSGAVFGRKAGQAAAERALRAPSRL